MHLKNVAYEQKHFQSIVLPEAQCAEEERADIGHVPYHGERKNSTVQLQVGRGGKIVECGNRSSDRKEQRRSGRQPYAFRKKKVITI